MIIENCRATDELIMKDTVLEMFYVIEVGDMLAINIEITGHYIFFKKIIVIIIIIIITSHFRIETITIYNCYTFVTILVM